MTNIFDDAKKYAELVGGNKQNPQGQAKAKNYVQNLFKTYIKELARAMQLKAGYISGSKESGMMLKGISLAGNPRIDFLKALSLNGMAKKGKSNSRTRAQYSAMNTRVLTRLSFGFK